MNIFFDLVKQHIWFFEIIAGIIILVIIHLFIKHFLRILKSKSKIKKYTWKNKLDYIILKPAYLFIWGLGILYILDVLFIQFGVEEIRTYIKPIRNTIIVFCISWFLFRWKNVVHEVLLLSKKRKALDKSKLHLISKLSSVVIFFITFLIILQVLGINIMPIIAFGGVGAAAIGFAAKDVIANFFGGLMIYTTRPFTKGDFIEVPEKSILGTVENIGWYLTCINDLDRCPIYIPNSLFATSQMKNKTRRSHKKIEEKISIRYEDFEKLQTITLDIKNMLKKEEKIDQEIEPIVCFMEFNEYSLDIVIRTYVFDISYNEFMEVKEGILLKIKEIIEKNKADIPFPTTVVSLQKEL